MDDIINKIIDILDIDCEVLENLDHAELLERYEKELSLKNAYSPLLIVPSGLILELLESSISDDFDSYKEFLEDAKIKSKELDLKDAFKGFLKNIQGNELLEFDDFKEKKAKDYFKTSINHARDEKKYEKIILAKIPTDKPWELALWIPISAARYGLLEIEQAKVFEHYYKKYKAVPAIVSCCEWGIIFRKSNR